MLQRRWNYLAIATVALLTSACSGDEASDTPATTQATAATTIQPTPPAAPAPADSFDGKVDSKRFAPAPNEPTAVRQGPNRGTPVVYYAQNGEELLSNSQTTGEKIADSFGYASKHWFQVETPEGVGYIADTWFGRFGAGRVDVCQ